MDINFCKIEFDFDVIRLPRRGKYHEREEGEKAGEEDLITGPRHQFLQNRV